jgi:hypothetical protein
MALQKTHPETQDAGPVRREERMEAEVAHVRSPFEVRSALEAAAKRIGMLMGVDLAVVYVGDGLFFSNSAGELVRDGPYDILAASAEDIASGDFLKLFSQRAMYAALSETIARTAIAMRTLGAMQ